MQGGITVTTLHFNTITMTVTGGPAVIRMHCKLNRTADHRRLPFIYVTRGNRSVLLCWKGVADVTPVPQDAPWSIATHATEFGEDASAVTSVAAAAVAAVPVEITVLLLSRCFATDELNKAIAQQYRHIHDTLNR